MNVNVQSEFGELKRAIVHDASNMVDISIEDWPNAVPPEEFAKHPEVGPVEKRKLEDQHGYLRHLLEEAGVELVSPETQPDAFCQVYTRDPGFAVRDTLFMGQMRDNYRVPEIAGLSVIRKQVAKYVYLGGPSGQRIEGVDVMVLRDDLVLVGTGQISNKAGFTALRRHLKTMGIENVVRVPHTALYLDCAFAPLPNGNGFFSRKNLPKLSHDLLKKFFGYLIPLDEEEDLRHLAANVLWLNPEEVVSPKTSPQTNTTLRAMGYRVQELDYGEPIHCWGSVRCTVGPLERAPVP